MYFCDLTLAVPLIHESVPSTSHMHTYAVWFTTVVNRVLGLIDL